MLRSSILLLSSLFVVAFAGAGCQLDTDGQSGPQLELDASGAPSTAPVCNLICGRGSHCEIHAEGPVCTSHSEPAADAGAGSVPPTTTPPTTTPPTACRLACALGTHCELGSQGPACVSDTKPPVVSPADAGAPNTPTDAGPPPVETCTLSCGAGRHCVLTAKGQICAADDKVDAGGETACGSETCAADEKCCNASCGACEPRGSACPAVACPAVDAGAPKQTCANTKCPPRTYCDDISGSAECIELPSCDTVKCTPGTMCQLVQVQCVRAPCPPLPMCVPKEPQVCTLACKVGTHCAFTANGQKCEPDDPNMSCGKKMCGPGQVCCNASCGICSSPDGACIAIACDTTDETD